TAAAIARARAELGAAGRPVVLAVGRLATQKGFGVLLAAAEAWQERDPRPLVAIAGEGPLEGELRETARRHGVEVSFLAPRRAGAARRGGGGRGAQRRGGAGADRPGGAAGRAAGGGLPGRRDPRADRRGRGPAGAAGGTGSAGRRGAGRPRRPRAGRPARRRG